MAVCASLVTYFQFHQSSFLFSVGNLSPTATTSVVATILFRITERYWRENKNNFETKVKISRFTLVKTEGHHETCAHSLWSLITKLLTSLSTFRLYSQNFDFNLDILTFWLSHKRATECLRWKYPTWQSTVLFSCSFHCANHQLGPSSRPPCSFQLAEDVPRSPTDAPLTFSTAFDVISVSVEISERLQLFCRWSKRTLRQLHRQSGCPRH